MTFSTTFYFFFKRMIKLKFVAFLSLFFLFFVFSGSTWAQGHKKTTKKKTTKKTVIKKAPLKKTANGKDFVEIKSKINVVFSPDSTVKSDSGLIKMADTLHKSNTANENLKDTLDKEIEGVDGGEEDLEAESENETTDKTKEKKVFSTSSPNPLKKKSSKYVRYLSESNRNESDTTEYTFFARKTLMREDTTAYDDIFSQDIVVISEELAIDCVWVTMTEYFAVWDSETVNPYKFDPTKFNDTIQFTLYDTAAKLLWSPPLDTAVVNSNFGYRSHRWHHGIDLDLNTGDPVYAPFDGIVRIAKSVRGGYGRFVVLRHLNGLETVHGHLSKILVDVGIYVKAGEKIGLGGSTGRSSGPHLHYETRYQGIAFDPKLLYNFETNSLKDQFFTLIPEHFRHLKTRSYGGGSMAYSRSSTYHIVRSGDSLWKISKRYRTTTAKLCKLNNLSPKAVLRLKQRIRLK